MPVSEKSALGTRHSAIVRGDFHSPVDVQHARGREPVNMDQVVSAVGAVAERLFQNGDDAALWCLCRRIASSDDAAVRERNVFIASSG